jgi:hypothetical protein
MKDFLMTRTDKVANVEAVETRLSIRNLQNPSTAAGISA